MRYIDMETWSRREHFQFFSSFGFPYFGLTVNMDITAFRPALKQRGVSFTVAMLYVIARAANGIPEFRRRLRDDGVVEHEVVHPAITILADDDRFRFCFIEYHQHFATFATGAARLIEETRKHGTLGVRLHSDDFLPMTSIPWVSFTSFMHAAPLEPTDALPRFAWGKMFEDGDRLLLPLNVQVHHGIVDGLHVGQFYTRVQELLDRPEVLFVEG